jgi:hypothetical protein
VPLDLAVVAELGPLGRRAAGRIQGRDRRIRQRLVGGDSVQHGPDVLAQPKQARPRGRDGRRLIGRQLRRLGRGLGPPLLCSLGQELGYPAVTGGAGELTAALVRRLEARGGQLVCGAPVQALEVRGGRAVAVRTVDGQVVPVGRAVIGAVDAITLYRHLIGEDHLPPAVVADLGRFQFDNATVKVDWA